MYKEKTNKPGITDGLCRKLWRIMRLTTVILIASLLQVSAAGFAQRVTLSEKNASLQRVLQEIRKQSGYNLFYDARILPKDQKVSIAVKEVTVEEALNSAIKGLPLTYEINDKSVVIKKSEPSLIDNLKEKVKETLNLFRADSVVFRGTVVDEKGLPMPGATVRVKGKKTATKSKENGEYSILAPVKGALVISFIGYKDQEISLLGLDGSSPVNVMMQVGQGELEEVVVSTGYQDLPKERATGSFEVITAKQLQHSTDPNLIRRLEGITTSMNFNNPLTPTSSAGGSAIEARVNPRRSPLDNLTIRGKNMLGIKSNSGQVLVVIDGIASPYPIENVNPNDVESVTILKDAAAASIWGSRAANGVIVVKTKNGGYSQPTSISFNSSFNVTEKMDLFYKKKMSVSDFIDIQRDLYYKDYPTEDTSAYLPDPTFEYYQSAAISPVFEIMNAWKKSKGDVSITERDAQLDALRGNDIRRDYTKYLLRNAFQQNYSLGIQGGSQKTSYRLSAGYDKTLNNTINSGSDRLVLTYGINVRPLKRLELQGQVSYALSRSNNQGENAINFESNELFYPYQRLVDDHGNPVSVARTYRPVFIDILERTYGDRIQNMRYVPLKDINEGSNTTRDQNLNLSLNARYNINEMLSANLTYNYNRGLVSSALLQKQNSFYMRSLINYYTDPATLKSALNIGDLYSPSSINSNNQTLRGQLNLNKKWGERHELSAIAGMDISQNYALNTNNQYYGYNQETLRYQQLISNLEVPTLYRLYDFFPNRANLPSIPRAFSNSRIRTISSYANAAYTFLERYTVSSSIRKDGSSQFGEGSNKSGTPFYSAGLSWSINKESFYHLDLIPRLQLRATFGYNGNVNSFISANAYIYNSAVRNDVPGGYPELPTSITANLQVSNRLLRPEKTGILNLGIDFGFKGGRISGSVEYYDKRTSDLLSESAVDPSKGFNKLTFNIADIHGWGTDFTLNSINLRGQRFGWSSTFLFSYNRAKVKDLFIAKPETVGMYINGAPNYNKGYDISRLFAYRWAGLDPNTGDPRGYLNDQMITIDNTDNGRKNLLDIRNAPGTSSSIRYMGSSVPVYYGSLRNTFNYNRLDISFNLMYKLGYYFRRPEGDLASYDRLFSFPGNLIGAEYSKRWQKSGDELSTNVPSLAPNSTIRDVFYQFSEINVLKADHVRLQEINLSYSFNKGTGFIKNPRIYANVNNLGIIWRANKLGLDPDIGDYPNPRTYSFGFSANF